jgi:ABC-2 type transport system permease protein
MKKYLEVAKVSFNSMIAYRFDVFNSAVLSIVKILLAFIMWRVIFNGKTEIGGFTFSMMITYYIISTMLGRLDQSGGLVWQFSSEIREGQFTKYMIRPLNPMLYFLSVAYSKTVFIFGLNAAAAVLWAFLFRGNFLLPSDTGACILAVGIFLLGLNFLVLLNYLTSILSFRFLDVGGLHMVKDNIIQFLTGALIPLSLLPGWLQEVFRYFPFYYVYYLPTSLYLGTRYEEATAGLVVLIVWNLGLLGLNALVYRQSVKWYEGVGI